MTDLTTTVQSNGVLLQWNPILGSIGCRVEGGLAPSGSLQTLTAMGEDVDSYFVSQGKLKSGKTYRWHVQCGCSKSKVGDWSVWDEFTWNGGSGLVADEGKSMPADMQVFPNPTSSELHVSLSRDIMGLTSIKVFDAMGSMVHTTSAKINAGDVSFTLDLGHLSSGIYVLELSSDDIAIRKRFVKE